MTVEDAYRRYKNMHLLRKSFGMTQQQLADMMGVHLATVSKWERGDRVPTLEYAILLDRVLMPMEMRYIDIMDRREAAVKGEVIISDDGLDS